MLWLLCFCGAQLRSSGQNGVAPGDAIGNLSANKVLNNTSFTGLNQGLTIVDFFGTWCVPCLKALPHLAKLKADFANDLTIVLVSNEGEPQLQKFIAARSGFAFPVVVDAANEWNNRFAPPALPYTVVVKDGTVLAITEGSAITNDAVAAWLAQAVVAKQAGTEPTTNRGKPSIMTTTNRSRNSLVALSQDYIYAAKTDGVLDSLTQALAAVPFEDLKRELVTDADKKAFWINLYNGYTQAALKADTGQYKSRNAFFKQKSIGVAGDLYSLDDIEHGILRRSKIKWSLGYLNKLFPSKREKDLRVNSLDYRLHFALNCGAKSCPPIAFYNNQNLDAQLDGATKAYLTTEAEWDSAANAIRLPKLMSWFRADFGGKKGMRRILRQHGIIAAAASPKIKFKPYDWTLTLNNYTTQKR